MKTNKISSKRFLKAQEYLFFSRRKVIMHYYQDKVIQMIKKKSYTDFDLNYGKFTPRQSITTKLENLYNPIWVSEI